MKLRVVGAALAATLLASCAMLSAEAPLFTPADQDPAFVLAEGLWAAKEPDCKIDAAKSAPGDDTCVDWAHIARSADGSWTVKFDGDSESDGPLRLIVAAAAPRGTHPRAPLYVAESVNLKNGEIGYGALVPRGEDAGPVTRLAVAGVSCSVATDDYSAIDGIALTREDGKVVKCIASTQGAVREATRRAAVETLATIGDNELVFVRP